MRLLGRLCGLETELALYADPARFGGRQWRRVAYERLVAEISRSTPCATASGCKEGVFLANGGAVAFEGERLAAGAGLIELATPECRGPRELLLYQRAMEQLARHAAQQIGLTFIKNDRDAHDSVYGAQENYEVPVGGPISLWIWRLGLIALVPLILLCWACTLLTLLLLLLYFLVTALLVASVRLLSPRHVQPTMRLLWGGDVVSEDGARLILPVWLESLLIRLSSLYSLPVAVALWGLVRIAVFRRTRRLLTPFLISRPILVGAGMVDRRGRFLLADKAPAINCLLGFSAFLGARPVFAIGNFFKAVCIDSFTSWRTFARLFRPRQRLQLAIGDANMCESAEFLKIGSTLLVLDAIEAGYLEDAPQFARPVQALQTFVGDPTLTAAVRDRRGRLWTAVEIQRYYLSVCHRFVRDQADGVSDEVEEVLSVWEDALQALENASEDPAGTDLLVGTLDWPTKRYLVDQVGPGGRWEVKKKIDIRYHELSEDGYYETIRDVGLAPRLVDETSLERAMRWPPSETPAARRGRAIREFTGGEMTVVVGWHDMVVRNRKGKRRLSLETHGAGIPAPHTSLRSRRPHL